MLEFLVTNTFYNFFYLYFLILLPIPTTPIVILFFINNNYYYGFLIYVCATVCAFLTLFLIPKLISKEKAKILFNRIAPKKIRDISYGIIKELTNKNIFGIISIISLTQIPIFIFVPLFSYFNGKKRILIQYALFSGSFNAIIYISIAMQGNKIYRTINNRDNLSPQSFLEGLLLSLSLIWIVFIYIKKLMKIFKKTINS